MPRPAAPGLSAAYDYEYERNGVSSLFMLFAPLDGWRRVEVRERRTKVDWAHVIKKLVDEDYPDRDRIVLVMDNLNTHKLSSLYEAFEPAEARLIAERLEIHYTPKHGSWLNMAEIEIGVLARQCLDRRIANQDILRGEVNAWQNQRNRDVIRVDWRFTTENARIKLKSLYPSIQKVEPLVIRGTRAALSGHGKRIADGDLHPHPSPLPSRERGFVARQGRSCPTRAGLPGPRRFAAPAGYLSQGR